MKSKHDCSVCSRFKQWDIWGQYSIGFWSYFFNIDRLWNGRPTGAALSSPTWLLYQVEDIQGWYTANDDSIQLASPNHSIRGSSPDSTRFGEAASCITIACVYVRHYFSWRCAPASYPDSVGSIFVLKVEKPPPALLLTFPSPSPSGIACSAAAAAAKGTSSLVKPPQHSSLFQAFKIKSLLEPSQPPPLLLLFPRHGRGAARRWAGNKAFDLNFGTQNGLKIHPQAIQATACEKRFLLTNLDNDQSSGGSADPAAYTDRQTHTHTHTHTHRAFNTYAHICCWSVWCEWCLRFWFYTGWDFQSLVLVRKQRTKSNEKVTKLLCLL